MNKGTRNTLIIIAIILLMFGILCAVYMNKTEPMNANATDENTLLQNSDAGLENMINDIFEDPKQVKTMNKILIPVAMNKVKLTMIM